MTGSAPADVPGRTGRPGLPAGVHLLLDEELMGTPDVGGWAVLGEQRVRFDGWLELLAVLRVLVRDGSA